MTFRKVSFVLDFMIKYYKRTIDYFHLSMTMIMMMTLIVIDASSHNDTDYDYDYHDGSFSSDTTSGGDAGSNSGSSSSSSSSSSIFELFDSWVVMLHEYLPIEIQDIVNRYILLLDTGLTDEMLMGIIVILISCIVIQVKAFTRPQPVPYKQLPKRPMITISFRPDDISTEMMQQRLMKNNSSASTTTNTTRNHQHQDDYDDHHSINSGGGNISSNISSGGSKSSNFWSSSQKEQQKQQRPKFSRGKMHHHVLDEEDDDDDDDDDVAKAVRTVLDKSYVNENDHDDHFYDVNDESTNRDDTTSTINDQHHPFKRQSHHIADLLPDSFAPLLSSSITDINLSAVTADLIHAMTASITVKLRHGIHEIPLDKDTSRPQLRFHIPNASCKVVAAIAIGSDGLTNEQDFHCTDTKNLTSKISSTKTTGRDMKTTAMNDNNSNKQENRSRSRGLRSSTNSTTFVDDSSSYDRVGKNDKTKKPISKMNKSPTMTSSSNTIRSKPMVKHGGIIFDPPMPLQNVAPTLIHFPTLFEDLQYMPILRNIQIIRYCIDFIISIKNLLEKCLWIIETHVCQIHLSQIHIRPIYKGSSSSSSKKTQKGKQQQKDQKEVQHLPEWRLSLSFSGHVLICGYVPIPFINVVLPTFIIPQPHALLEYLLSAQPLASARLRRENIAEQRIALATINMAESWKTDLKLVVTPPAIGIDLTLPGGLAVAMEAGVWRDHQPGMSVNAKYSSKHNPIVVGGPPSIRMPQKEQFQTKPESKARRFQRSDGSKQGLGDVQSKNHLRSRRMRRNDDVDDDHDDDEADRNNNEDFDDADDLHSMSSWTTRDGTHELGGNMTGMSSSMHGNRTMSNLSNGGTGTLQPIFDANEMIPWTFEFAAKGSVSHEKMTVHVLKCEAKHDDFITNPLQPIQSKFATRGSMAIWKYNEYQNKVNQKHWKKNPESSSQVDANVSVIDHHNNNSTMNHHHHQVPFRPTPSSFQHRRVNSHPELETDDSPSVAAILLFPDETLSFHSDLRMLQYDYVFDVFEDTKLDAVTISVGATHPLLNGGTMVTTILDSIYSYGSCSARENAVLDPNERRRKRNILRHLPCIDFTFGIQNIFIPPESNSYSDDGQTLLIPELEGGRMMVHFLGGIDPSDTNSMTSATVQEAVLEGIKVIADYEFASCCVRSEGNVKEFPELDIFPGVKLRTSFLGVILGRVKAHLRPQSSLSIKNTLITTGPNVFNPLEAYEIDFSGSSLSVKIKEFSTTLGHRRIMFPAESTFLIQVTESVVDMGFEGKTKCDLSWDFQGLSPILQVTEPGSTPETALPENKDQVSLLVAPLRQGRFSLNVSSVGGISITKAATSRVDREGLYDWKFFNALVSPDGESAGRIMDVLHDKRTMGRMLQVTKLLSNDLHSMLEYGIRQVWRAKEILDQEGVIDPRHAIPMYKMARLISLFLAGDDNSIDSILPIVQRVVDGDGVDVVQLKVLLRDHLQPQVYEDYAAEIDRFVRFLAVALGPVNSQPFVDEEVVPLVELPYHAKKMKGIPSASHLYAVLEDKPQLPLDPLFCSIVSRIAPYLTFRQIEYILHVRPALDWPPSDLRRIRYVYSIKRKVLEIAESYGGLSFLPQSFFLSVFLGEATRTSLRASKLRGLGKSSQNNTRLASRSVSGKRTTKLSTMSRLRRRRIAPTMETSLLSVTEESFDDYGPDSPSKILASLHSIAPSATIDVSEHQSAALYRSDEDSGSDSYELCDSLLGPQDVAILLQAGLASVMKGSTVVQLNQRMLLDLICSQPRSFSLAVLAEIGSGQGSPRSLTSALLSLLELDQTAFKSSHQIDMHALLESWVPGIKIPRRDDYMAGGRVARKSYYGDIFAVSKSILEDAESYMALKLHLQRVRKTLEKDPLPQERDREMGLDAQGHDSRGHDSQDFVDDNPSNKFHQAVRRAKSLIAEADNQGNAIMHNLVADKYSRKRENEYERAANLYQQAFQASAAVQALDKHAFYSPWFRNFYQRNYDALQVKSVYDNVIEDVDRVRYWLGRLWKGAKKLSKHNMESGDKSLCLPDRIKDISDDIFEKPDSAKMQILVDVIIECLIYEITDRERLRNDPLVRLLIPNPPGGYDFVIISAAGVVTEGKNGTELESAFRRLEMRRGVQVIRADTATARSLEYNAGKIEDAIHVAVNKLKKPYGLLGYSQGCANALLAESMLLSGSPEQQLALTKNGGLVCRQLLFSASNGSFHGPAMDRKVQHLISMGEDFFKSQAGYFSRAFSTTVLESLNSVLDSPHFHKMMGGAQSFLEEGCRTFWREAQHLSYVPTCTLRGVLEEHTTPECLEMLSHMLTKQSGSPLHDSQVHVFDAVGYPVYHHNRNGRVLKKCNIGAGAIQRTHHWSPLFSEVDFVTTSKDIELGSFDCAKDRHIFPWVDVNVRFGFINYSPLPMLSDGKRPSNLVVDASQVFGNQHSENHEEWEKF